MVEVDEIGLVVLEIVENLPFLFEPVRLLEGGVEEAGHLLGRVAQHPVVRAREEGQKLLMLHADEVLPQEVTCPEQAGEVLEDLRA